MNTSKNNLSEIGKTNPFKVPEGYFERFSDDLMSKLPERVVEEPKVISLWGKLRPWTYVAATLMGVMLMFRIFSGSPEGSDMANNSLDEIEVISDSDLDDFYSYYEDQAIINAYRETLYESTSATEGELSH